MGANACAEAALPFAYNDAHDVQMRTKLPQLELLDSEPFESGVSIGVDAVELHGLRAQAAEGSGRDAVVGGRPMNAPLSAIYEDPANPRTEFPEAELDELAEDIRQHGILQPIVVHPVDDAGRFRIHFGAKRCGPPAATAAKRQIGPPPGGINST